MGHQQQTILSQRLVKETIVTEFLGAETEVYVEQLRLFEKETRKIL